MSKKIVPTHKIDELFEREFPKNLVEKTSANGSISIEAEMEISTKKKKVKLSATLNLVLASALAISLAYILTKCLLD